MLSTTTTKTSQQLLLFCSALKRLLRVCSAVSFAQKSFYQESVNKDDGDMPMSVIVSLTVTTKRVGVLSSIACLTILAPLLPMTCS